MKNVLIILAIMLIMLCPTQERRIKRKRDLGIVITTVYIISFAAITLKGLVKQWKYTNKFKNVYNSLLQDFKGKEEYMIEKIDECRALVTVKDYILTTITKIIQISIRNGEHEVNQEECEQIVTRLVQNPNQPNEIKENQVKCLDNQIKRDIRSVFGEIAKLIGTEAKSSCDSEIFPFFNNLNSIMIQKKQILAEIKSKLSDTLTLYKLWRHDYSKMANTVNFGSANDKPTRITKWTVSNFLKSWLKTLVSLGITVSANTVAHNAGTDTNGYVISLLIFESLGALGNVADSAGLFNRFKKFSFSSLVTNTLTTTIFNQNGIPILSVQKAAFFSYLTKNLILINIQRLGQLPAELSKLISGQDIDINPVHDTDSSIAFRQMVLEKVENNFNMDAENIQRRIGLYFTEIAVSYSFEEARLMFKNGFEILSWFKFKGKPELFVLGNRFNDSLSVLLHYELIPFDEANIKPEEIGSDYKGFLSNKLKPLIRVKLLKHFNTYCTDSDIYDSDIYDLANMAEVDVKLTKKHYLVSLMIRRDKYDSEKFKTHVNCFNKYKKLDNMDRIRICERNNDFVKHLCLKGSSKEIELAEINDYISSSNVYNLFSIHFNVDLQSKFPQASINKFGELNLLHYPKITDFSNETENKVPLILCQTLKQYNYRREAIDSFYGSIWSDPESIAKSEKALKIKFENENSQIRFQKVEKNAHVYGMYMNKDVIRYRHLLMVDRNDGRFLPITDFVHNVLNKRAGQLNGKILSLISLENYTEMPFKEIFTGFYHNHDKCSQYSSLVPNAYISPLLTETRWTSNDSLAKAFAINERNTRITLERTSRHFYLTRVSNGIEFEQNSFGERTFSRVTQIRNQHLIETLKECSFASLAYEVIFEDETIKNPKISIYPFEKNIKVSLVENLDEELIYTKELAITFTLIDVEQEANEKSDLNKFEVIANAERKYISFGYKKVEDFDGESDFKIYFPDKTKYIVVNFWSKLDLRKIKENAEKSISQCNSVPINDIRDNIEELNNQAENRIQRKSSHEIELNKNNLRKLHNEPEENHENLGIQDLTIKKKNSHEISRKKKQKPIDIDTNRKESDRLSNKEEQILMSPLNRKERKKKGPNNQVYSQVNNLDISQISELDKESR